MRAPVPFPHGCRNRRARSETIQGSAGQAGHNAGVVSGEGEVGVSVKLFTQLVLDRL